MSGARAPLTAHQLTVLRRIAEDPGQKIVCMCQCYWTTPSTPTHPGGGLVHVPVWWTEFTTVRALERKCFLVREGVLLDYRRDGRLLTDEGRAVLETAEKQVPILPPKPPCQNCGCITWVLDPDGIDVCSDCSLPRFAAVDMNLPLCSTCRRRHGPEVRHESE